MDYYFNYKYLNKNIYSKLNTIRIFIIDLLSFYKIKKYLNNLFRK